MYVQLGSQVIKPSRNLPPSACKFNQRGFTWTWSRIVEDDLSKSQRWVNFNTSCTHIFENVLCLLDWSWWPPLTNFSGTVNSSWLSRPSFNIQWLLFLTRYTVALYSGNVLINLSSNQDHPIPKMSPKTVNLSRNA